MATVTELLVLSLLFLGLVGIGILVLCQQRRLSTYSSLHLMVMANNDWYPVPIWNLRARFRVVGATAILTSRGWEVEGFRQGRLTPKKVPGVTDGSRQAD